MPRPPVAPLLALALLSPATDAADLAGVRVRGLEPALAANVEARLSLARMGPSQRSVVTLVMSVSPDFTTSCFLSMNGLRTFIAPLKK